MLIILHQLIGSASIKSIVESKSHQYCEGNQQIHIDDFLGFDTTIETLFNSSDNFGYSRTQLI